MPTGTPSIGKVATPSETTSVLSVIVRFGNSTPSALRTMADTDVIADRSPVWLVTVTVTPSTRCRDSSTVKESPSAVTSIVAQGPSTWVRSKPAASVPVTHSWYGPTGIASLVTRATPPVTTPLSTVPVPVYSTKPVEFCRVSVAETIGDRSSVWLVAVRVMSSTRGRCTSTEKPWSSAVTVTGAHGPSTWTRSIPSASVPVMHTW